MERYCTHHATVGRRSTWDGALLHPPRHCRTEEHLGWRIMASVYEFIIHHYQYKHMHTCVNTDRERHLHSAVLTVSPRLPVAVYTITYWHHRCWHCAQLQGKFPQLIRGGVRSRDANCLALRA